MCDPLTLAVVGAAAIGAGKQALIMEQENKVAKASARSAVEEGKAQYGALNLQEQQIANKGVEEATQRQLQAMREQATLRASFGDAGVMGNSTIRQLNNALVQSGYDIGNINANTKAGISQAEANKTSVYITEKARIKRAKSSIPNPWIRMLQIGMAGAGGAAQGFALGSALSSPSAGASTTSAASSGGGGEASFAPSPGPIASGPTFA